jgi:hypothetical protein
MQQWPRKATPPADIAQIEALQLMLIPRPDDTWRPSLIRAGTGGDDPRCLPTCSACTPA